VATDAGVFLIARKAQHVVALLSVVFCLSFIHCQDGNAQDGASIFKEKCAGCHTIGGGDLVGPDLARTSSWPDAELQESIKRMEASAGPLSDAEVNSLISYLKNAKSNNATSKKDAKAKDSKSLDNHSIQPGPQSEIPKPENEPASAARGKRLFYGDEAFKNGGLSCIACHSIDHSGGNMAPDLTGVADKMPAAALVSACENTPFKVMKAAYKDHAILHQEALDLQAYLATLKEPHEKTEKLPFGIYAGSFAAIALALIAFGYRGRNTSVRSKLQRRD